MNELFIVYKNIFELIKFRGYDAETNPYNDLASFSQFAKMHDPLIIKGKLGMSAIRVFLVQNKDILSRQKLSGIINSNSGSSDEIIIVYDKPISSSYNLAIIEAESNRTGPKIWYMLYDNLKMIIPKYCLNQGEYKILSNEEKDQLTKMNRIDPKSWPKLREYDVLNLWIGGQPGQIVEFTGPSETGGMSTKYFEVISWPRYTSK